MFKLVIYEHYLNGRPVPFTIGTQLMALYNIGGKFLDFGGKYTHEKSENLDAFFREIGVPYLIRLMITRSNPTLEIIEADDVNKEWNIIVSSLLRTNVKKFKLGVEYTEDMKGVKLKCITTLEDGRKLVTISEDEGKTQKSTTIYELNDDGIVQTLIHEKSGVKATRYFKRIA